MSGPKKENKNAGWNEWQQKRKDWNVSNSKRPKLDICKQNLSGTSSKAPEKATENVSRVGRSSLSLKKTTLPIKPRISPSKENDGLKFSETEEEELDVREAIALADAVEYEMAFRQPSLADCGVSATSKCAPGPSKASSNSNGSSLLPISHASSAKNAQASTITVPGSISKQILPSTVNYGNNGSSGFDVLFGEDLAEEDVEECMMLASQEIQASQKQSVDTSAYNFFVKDVNAHSSILEPTINFKKPVLKEEPKPNIKENKGSDRINLPSAASSSSVRVPCHAQKVKPAVVNPQAEAEVRRLTFEYEKLLANNNKLKESLRTKEGEAAILRSQLKKSVCDLTQEKTVSEQRVKASQQQYGERFLKMRKEMDALQMKLNFQEAENNTTKQRLLLLTQTSPQIKVVQPSTSSSSSTPQREPKKKKYVSNFLNRSTFEEKPESTHERSKKRLRLSESEPVVESNNAVIQEMNVDCLKPEMKDNESQTLLIHDELDNVTWMQDLVNLSVCERLAERLSGLQLVSDKTQDDEFVSNRDVDIDDMETIPTMSLLSLTPNSRIKKCTLDEKQRPRLLNCSKSLKALMCCNDPNSLSENEEESVLNVLQECCGIVHYHLFQLQELGNSLTDKQLRERDRDIIIRRSQVLPLCKQYDLLDEKQWCKDELKVDVRRSLGILSELVSVYDFAALLLTGQSKDIIPKHKFSELPEFIRGYEENGSSDIFLNLDQFWFLKVLYHTVSSIVRLKCTLSHSGVLVGLLVLLKHCAQQKTIIEESQTLVVSIIREVVLTRPPSTVLLALVDFLIYCSDCEEIMKGLCTNCDDEDCVGDNNLGSGFLSTNTCILQSLCIQLKYVSDTYCWRLVDALIRWLSLVISQGWGAPSWILSSPCTSHVPCCSLLISTVVSLLWNTYQTYLLLIEEDSVEGPSSSAEPVDKDNSLQTSFPRIMRKAISLFHGLLVNNMFDYMAHVEGSYELLLRRLSQLDNLILTPALQRELDQLLRVEQLNSKPDSPVHNNDDSDYHRQYWNSALSLLKLSP